MSESLRDLLRQGADTVDRPDPDVDDLVARAERRLVRRRLAAVGLSAATVVLIVAGGLALRPETGRPEPAPPGPTKTTSPLGTPRALTYAEGSMIHFGDRTIDAGRTVDFVEATDDGVVYVAKGENTVWFSDGSVTDQIGVVQRVHFSVSIVSANPGSLVAWVDPTKNASEQTEIVVYDSHERQVVARVPSPGGQPHSLAISGHRMYWEVTLSGGATSVSRYELSTGTAEVITRDTYQAELASNPRMLRIGRPTYSGADIPGHVSQRLAFFKRVGTRLVASDSVSQGSEANDTAPTRLLSGQALRLRVPEGYGAGFDESLVVVQWLDDTHLVLFAHHEHNEFPAHRADLLVCPVPAGTCRVVVPASNTPYVPPGNVP